MYELIRGPLVWIGLLGFACGALYKLVDMFRRARAERTVLPTMSVAYGARSVAHWLVPFASRNTRLHPVLTLVSFGFHLCLLLTPIFAMGHAVLWRQSFGISWWSLPARVTDVMTVVVVAAGLFLLVRRVAAPEARNVTTWRDVALLLLVIAPFATGFLSRQHILPARPMLIVHIVTGVGWLLAIPFTRLSHMLWFVFSRAYMGSEFGAVRNARDW